MNRRSPREKRNQERQEQDGQISASEIKWISDTCKTESPLLIADDMERAARASAGQYLPLAGLLLKTVSDFHHLSVYLHDVE
jgi:hypothetical protein